MKPSFKLAILYVAIVGFIVTLVGISWDLVNSQVSNSSILILIFGATAIYASFRKLKSQK
jgi:hypothetical protein